MNHKEPGLPETVPLWPEHAPLLAKDDARGPQLTVYLPSPEFVTGQTVVVCPGGGYKIQATAKEGHRVAHFLNARGHAAAVLEYRLAPYRHPVPLIDAQRAIRYLRHHAPEWQLDPAKIGILGFSAGGHLAGSAATQPVVEAGLTGDAVDGASSRPDFAILVYPVVSFVEAAAHSGSRDNLFGPEASPDLLRQLSIEKAVDAHTPPMFLAHAGDDAGVPPDNSILLYRALHDAGVPPELHIYESGGHGFGLADNHPWGEAMLRWLEAKNG